MDGIAQLGRRHPLYRYDGRGIGLSTLNSPRQPEQSVEDLEAVIDAAGLDQVILFGLSEGGKTAIEYAAKHPDRVSHLILYGSFLSADDFPVAAQERWATMLPLFINGWGAEEPACRQLFTSLFLPDGNRAQNHYFNEMQRASCDAESAMAYLMASTMRDVRELARSLDVPTLVFHRQGDLTIPVEAGRKVAETIPNAMLEILPGNNHWMLALEDDSEQIIEQIEEFVQIDC